MDKKISGIYSKSQIKQSVVLPITMVGNNLVDNIKKSISKKIEGKCIVDGYIKTDSINNIVYSAGKCQGENIVFDVVFDCFICNPVEGMLIECVVENVTKAGIKAKINEDVSPLIIFIARDHHYGSDYFSKIDDGSIKEGSNIVVRVIGQRFELNDAYIAIIGELIEERKNQQKTQKQNKPPIKIKKGKDISDKPKFTVKK